MGWRDILLLVMLMVCAVGMVSGAPNGSEYIDAEDEDEEDLDA